MNFRTLICLLPTIGFGLATPVLVVNGAATVTSTASVTTSDGGAQILGVLSGLLQSLVDAAPATASCSGATATACTTEATTATSDSSSSASSGLNGLFDLASSFLKSIEGVLGNVDWSSLFKSFSDILGNVDWSSLASTAMGMLDKIDWSGLLKTFTGLAGSVDWSSLLGLAESALGSLGSLGLRSESSTNFENALQAFVEANPDLSKALSELYSTMKVIASDVEAEALGMNVSTQVSTSTNTPKTSG